MFGELDPQGYADGNIVYVVPEHRRRGVTRALLAEFASRAREEGIEHITLDVATRNEVGREVWRRMGFTEWALRLTAPIERLRRHRRGSAANASPRAECLDDRAAE